MSEGRSLSGEFIHYQVSEMIMKVFQLFQKQKNSEKRTPAQPAIIVSGLPRSGTSMMMKMLEAGGVNVLTDNIRTPDDSNPKGYYEFERVKKLKDGDNSWLEGSGGKVVKVISALLEYLPPEHTYRIIFMKRNIEEVLASQKQMLISRGEPTDKVSNAEMARLFQEHLHKVDNWLSLHSNIETLYVSYNDILNEPQETVEKINLFLGGRLDARQMLETVDKGLYRQRKNGKKV